MQDLKEAMKAGDETRKSTIRLIRAAVSAAEIEKRSALIGDYQAQGLDVENMVYDENQFALTDEEVLDVMHKQAKQRRDSIAEFQKARRDDLVAAEQAELGIIESYLPRQLTRDEVLLAARKAASDLDVSNMAGMGLLMKHLMAELKGRADGRLVNEVVREVLSGG